MTTTRYAFTGQELFEIWRRHANAEGSRLGIEHWHRQSIKRMRAWDKAAEEITTMVAFVLGSA